MGNVTTLMLLNWTLHMIFTLLSHTLATDENNICAAHIYSLNYQRLLFGNLVHFRRNILEWAEKMRCALNFGPISVSSGYSFWLTFYLFTIEFRILSVQLSLFISSMSIFHLVMIWFYGFDIILILIHSVPLALV